MPRRRVVAKQFGATLRPVGQGPNSSSTRSTAPICSASRSRWLRADLFLRVLTDRPREGPPSLGLLVRSTVGNRPVGASQPSGSGEPPARCSHPRPRCRRRRRCPCSCCVTALDRSPLWNRNQRRMESARKMHSLFEWRYARLFALDLQCRDMTRERPHGKWPETDAVTAYCSSCSI